MSIAMKTDLEEGESVVRESHANMQRGNETVGGRLYLTNRRLIFESHAFNLQTGVTVLERSEITGMRKCWTKLLGIVPLVPTSVAVATRDGTESIFGLPKRDAWIEAIGSEPAPLG